MASSKVERKGTRFDTLLVVIAAVYLLTVWLDGIGSSLPLKTTPRVWLYFCQIAALFKNAGQMAIDYRAEGWSCAEHRWVEIDVRPWFRIDADNKENRFHRALQFYRKERKVMRALEEYVLVRSNEAPNGPKIGGVRFLSLRVPYPKLGEHVERAARKPLPEYPPEMRHDWYWTPGSRRKEQCGDRSPSPSAPAARDKEKEKDDEELRAPSSKDPEP
jgi:hypothetical protein